MTNMNNSIKLRLLFFILCIVVLTVPVKSQDLLKLENDKILAEFDPSNGSLIRLVNKLTNWNIVERKQLGQSFQMLVPIPDRRYNNINGLEQLAPQIKTNYNKIEFTWKYLKSKYLNQPIDITFIGTVSLNDQGLVYEGEIINNSNYTVEYIGWPYWGELAVPRNTKNFICQSKNETKELYPGFNSEHGYWGVEYPTNITVLPENAFLLIRNEEQGIYICSEQWAPLEMIICSFELIPGFEFANINPSEEVMDGQLVRIQFKANHVVYCAPKMNYQLQPVKMDFYKGNWQAGTDIYKNWKKKLPSTDISKSSWVTQPFNWQKINISNDKELVDYAKAGVQNGISVLRVNGWMKYEKESCIEVIDNLVTAIAECKRLGVKIMLEINFNSIDPRSEWCKKSLKNDVVTDPFGVVYDQRIICPQTHDLYNMLETEFFNLPVKLDVDGFIIDDNNHRGKTFYCFNPEHGHKIPEFTDAGIFQLDHYFADKMRQNKPEKVVLGLGQFDLQSTFYDGYFINYSLLNQSMPRYLDENIPIIASIDVKSARKDMNLCLKNRYNICYDLRFYNNDITSYLQIIQYGKQISAFRKKYNEFIWEGSFNDVLGATVKGSNISYAVYTNTSDGRKAVLLLNQSEQEKATVQVSIGQSKNKLMIASPESPKSAAFNGTTTLQPLSAALVYED